VGLRVGKGPLPVKSPSTEAAEPWPAKFEALTDCCGGPETCGLLWGFRPSRAVLVGGDAKGEGTVRAAPEGIDLDSRQGQDIQQGRTVIL